MAFAASPTTPAATNNTSNNTVMMAASPSSVDGSEAIAVPAEQTQVTISNSTSNQANTSTTTPAPTTASTPASTPTPTPDNKGKLEILTNPVGATVTIDGVSEGVSPIEGLSVDSGTHAVTVYLSGYDPQQETVEIANSETKKLFYTLVPTVKHSSTSTLTPAEKIEPEAASSSTSETSSYQDIQWTATCGADTTIVTNDINGISTAASNYDFTSLSTYADALYKDSQKAIDNSDLYSVSPDLQSAKDEYMMTMVQANWAAVFTSKAVGELENGNTEDGNADLKEATQYMNSFSEHATETTKLLNAYISKKN